MGGAAVTPVMMNGKEMNGGGNSNATAAQINSLRISAVIDRMGMQIRNGPNMDSGEFVALCLSLARGIDYAVANQETPSRAKELPLLLKQACQIKNEVLLMAAVLVLMISVKSACQNKWFSDKDCEELCGLANEIGSRFGSPMDFNSQPSSSHPMISTIMSRFYPSMKMGQVLAFVEAQPGYNAYVKDFHISKLMRLSPDEKARLLVARIDNTETSSCLISPPQVSFLLNGRGVERRTSVQMDLGPQMPTTITNILKYGSNLLQAVGEFNGNYIIVIALMSEVATLGYPTLQDYVQPPAAIVDPDSEIIEGPSRISLNCPISFRRIKTPVKGHSCKHLQCFDFDNFMDINSKRPSWRCPHCNNYLCFTDIRIDQNMVKVLKDVGENVNGVIISSDGSWKAIAESDDYTEKQSPDGEHVEPEQHNSAIFSNGLPDLLDLTAVDDEMDAVGTCEERKVHPNNSQPQSSAESIEANPYVNNFNEPTPIEDNFWSGIYLSTFGSGTPSTMSDAQIGCVPESTTSLVSPVLTDAISPAPNREAGDFNRNALVATSGPQNEIASPTALQLQQFQFGNAANNNEYGRSLPISRHVSRTPFAVQALPAQSSMSVPRRHRNSTTAFIQTGPLATSQTSAAFSGVGFNANSSNMERQQQFSGSHANSLQVPQMVSSSLQHLNTQRDCPPYSVRPAQQNGGLQTPNQLRVGYQLPSTLSGTFENSSQQQRLNLMMPHSVNQSAGAVQSSAQSSAPFLRAQGHQGVSQGLSTQAVGVSGLHTQVVAAQRATQMSKVNQPSRVASLSGNADGIRASPVGDQRGSMGNTSPSVTTTDAFGNLPPDQNWRPSGRMRGSLSGRAFSDALNQYNIIKPTQLAQASRAPSNTTPVPSTAQLQVLMANRAALQAANYTSISRAGQSDGSDVLPSHPSGIN